MSITDELREWAKDSTLSSWTAGHLTAIADRIDAEHQKALDEWKAKHGQMWLKGYSECHAELLEGNETLASDLESCGWVRLPKDADGEPIRVGDTVEYVDDTLAPRNVTSINLAGDGWWVYINGLGRRPDRYRHVTPDTWERIIDDAEALAREWFNTDMSENEHAEGLDALVARCKALCERTREDA